MGVGDGTTRIAVRAGVRAGSKAEGILADGGTYRGGKLNGMEERVKRSHPKPLARGTHSHGFIAKR